MAKAIGICRVCGKEYEYCHTFAKTSDNVYRWQEIACSPECGNIYFARVLRSRGINPEDEGIFVKDEDTAENKSEFTLSDDKESESVKLFDYDDDFEDEDDEYDMFDEEDDE